MAMATQTISSQVLVCLRYLAGQCDGAQKVDGHGFDKFDAPFGHDLAARNYLSNNQVIAAIRMLKRYSRQLETAGLHLPMVVDMVKEQKVEASEMEPKPEEYTSPVEPKPVEVEDKKPSADIVLSAEQQALLKVMEETKQHLFITGRAGAGKSVLLREFREETKKRVVIAAPTGIAALNVKGQTLHSLFKLPPQLYYPGTLAPNERLNSLLRRIDTLVIDEISMVRSDLLDAVDERLRQAFGNDTPFGGIQLVMFGDVYQLPPVVDKDLISYFEKEYQGYFFFNASVWKKAEFKIYELSQIFRQKDPVFKNILNAVRDGSFVDEQIEQLNVRHGATVPAEGTITLATTNNLVTQINQRRLDALPGKMYQYKAIITGEMKRGTFPTEEILQLKVGAQIVLLKNDKDGRWVNGSVGKIESLEKGVEVNIGGISYMLEKETWEEVAYEYDPAAHKVKAEVVSSFTQYPIRLAWALTIHKSQGQTYESVSIDLTTAAFAHGQMYVALSRCTSLEGLYLKMPVQRRDIIVDPKVTAFMARRETITVEVVEEAHAVAVEVFNAPEIVEVTIEEVATPAIKTVGYAALDLPIIVNKGGNNHASDWVKFGSKMSPEVNAKLKALKEARPDFNQAALIDSLLAEWLELNGL